MSLCLSRILAQTRWSLSMQKCYFQKFRQMYTPGSVGIIDYQNTRDKYKNMDSDTLKSFREKMEENVADDTNRKLVFSDDLKLMVHIVENDDDVELVEGLLTKFNNQNSKLRFDSFVFGPVVMRMYHYMNKPIEALDAYKNPKFESLFDQLSSHVLLLDLLFKNQMYEEIIEVYQIITENQYSFGKYAKTIMVVVFGALYKLNTEMSYKLMRELLQEMQESSHVPIRRVICFSAALALKRNNPQIALELLSPIQNQGFFLVRSIKALANCALNQIDETLIILASALTIDTPTKSTHTFPEDVITTVKNHIEKFGCKDHIIEFKRIEKQLKDFKHITSETLDETLCNEFTIFNPVNKMKKVVNASLDETPHDVRKFRRISRPGLQDMI